MRFTLNKTKRRRFRLWKRRRTGPVPKARRARLRRTPRVPCPSRVTLLRTKPLSQTLRKPLRRQTLRRFPRQTPKRRTSQTAVRSHLRKPSWVWRTGRRRRRSGDLKLFLRAPTQPQAQLKNKRKHPTCPWYSPPPPTTTRGRSSPRTWCYR
jgi:hypothetical protein